MASCLAVSHMQQHDDSTAPTYQTPGSVPRTLPRTLWAIRWLFPELECVPTLIDGERIHLGRSRTCDYRLEGQEVSARHAILSAEPGTGLQIRDHESTNGVYVDGQRLTRTEARRLQLGDVVRLGEYVGIVDRVTSAEAERPTRIERREIEIQFEVESERGPRRTERQSLGLVVGPSTQPSIDLLEKAAPTDCTVILVGETGTGKEYVAKALHAWSKRSGQYVGLNCWELKGDPGLARAKLFGVEAGAFTGAVPMRGAFRDADGGTLLLDEIMELPLDVQPMLLRTLQEKLVQPIGGKRPVSVDVRLVVASKRPLEQLVEKGAFSLDLYQRLCGLSLELAPLRERRCEIPFAFFTALADKGRNPETAKPIRPRDVEPRLVERLCLHSWPGNLRELVTLAGNYRRLWDRSGQGGYRFRFEDLPRQMQESQSSSDDTVREHREAVQLSTLIEALRSMLGEREPGTPFRRGKLNFELACERAGVQRSLGYRLFKKWDDLATRGLIELPNDDLLRALYRWYTEGKRD